jgi:plasmid stability protein
MKRTQIYLEEELYERLRRAAYEGRTSMAQVVREALVEYLAEERPAAGEVLAPAAKPSPKEEMMLREEDLTPEELEELKKNPLYHLIGLYSSDKGDAGIHHDYYLYIKDKN